MLALTLSTLPVGHRSLLTSSFRTCAPVQSDLDTERLAFYIKGAIATLAMVG